MIALLLSPPVHIDREEAARQAREELARSPYHQDDPGSMQRAIDWIVKQIGGFLDTTSDVVPGGLTGVLVILAVIVLALVVWRYNSGSFFRTAKNPTGEVITDRTRSAADHRAAAESAFARGEFDEAIRERFRAVVRELEQRGRLDVRPGRTADEVAAEYSVVALTSSARVFDEVSYGGRPGTPESYEIVRTADDAVRGRVRS